MLASASFPGHTQPGYEAMLALVQHKTHTRKWLHWYMETSRNTMGMNTQNKMEMKTVNNSMMTLGIML